VLGTQRKVDPEFEASLGHIVRSCIKKKKKKILQHLIARHCAGSWGHRMALVLEELLSAVCLAIGQIFIQPLPCASTVFGMKDT
jgi:hypothetical protein